MRVANYFVVTAMLFLVAGCSGSGGDSPMDDAIGIGSENIESNSNGSESATLNGIAEADSANNALGQATTAKAYLNESNYEAYLVQAFEIFMGTAYDQRLPTQHAQRLRQTQISNYREESDGVATDKFTTYECSNGGTTEHRNTTGISPIISFGYTADNCQFGGDIINGAFSLTGYRTISHDYISTRDYSVEFGFDDRMRVDGEYRRANGYYGYGNNPYNFTQHWRTKSLDYNIRYLGNTLTVTDATTDAWYGYAHREQQGDQFFFKYLAHLEGVFSMIAANDSEKIEPQVVHVEVTAPLTQEFISDIEAPYNHSFTGDTPLPRYTAGVLVLDAADGSSVTLTMNPNGPPTASLASTLGTSEFTVDWAMLDKGLVLRDITIEFPHSQTAQ